MPNRPADEILNDALELDPENRTRYVEEACAGDPDLLAEVQSLLALQARFPELLALPIPPTEEERKQIGPYPILAELGRGGMGIVYLAEDARLRRRIAAKLLPPRLARDPARLALFEREAQILASLNHSNIAVIHSLENEGGILFLTMEYVPGVTLAERIMRAPLSIEEALKISRQIARALEAAHSKGVIHRDLKPQNVMVQANGFVKVLDFGLARSLGPGETMETARGEDFAGAIVGTPGSMSPEQVTGGSVDHRTDIWAFGCILFECLAGTPAFRGDTPDEAMQATLSREPDWALLPSHTPAPLREILVHCLEKDPSRRLPRVVSARRIIEEELLNRSLERRRAELERERSARASNLPVRLDRFIGRVSERTMIVSLLKGHRLLTLTGPGGCGKTRLACETAQELQERFPDGVHWVDLSAAADPAVVPQAVGAALGLREQGKGSFTEILVDHLRNRKTLLILDNCEHLLQGCRALVTTLLAACPRIRVLTTSRERLRVDGEATLRVPPLALPGRREKQSPEELQQSEAVQLFVDRVSTVNPSFALTGENVTAVAEICSRLDGIPLALELAAARANILPLAEIATRLDKRFQLLKASGGSPLPHHQTLTALIDWSHDLLTETERILLRRLSIFAGGWTLGAAEQVCAGDGIETWEVLDALSLLFERSLVEVDVEWVQATGQPRYRMIETIRQYARERLTAVNEVEGVRLKHRDAFLALGEEAERHLWGETQGQWLRRLEVEHDNLRLALDTCRSTEISLGMHLAAAIGHYWMVHGHWTEGRTIYADLLARSVPTEDRPMRAHVLHWAANLAESQGDLAEARSLNEQSLAIRRMLNDLPNIARSLNNLGNVAQREGDTEHASELYSESLSIQRALDNKRDIAHSLNNLGALAGSRGAMAEARAYFLESLALKRELKDRTGIAGALNNLGTLAALAENYEQAEAFFQESLSIRSELGEHGGVAAILSNLGDLSEKRGDLARALELHQDTLAIRWELKNLRAVFETLESIGSVLKMIGDDRRAARILGAVEGIRERADPGPSPADKERWEKARSELRAHLAEDLLAEEWAQGRVLLLEDAVEFASRPPGRAP